MKKLITLVVVSSFFFFSSVGQTALPYFTGFDNTAEQAGWTLFRKGSTISSPWAYSLQSQLPYSGPKCLVHYYPVSEQTLDWFVSPPFDFSSGGKIDSIRFAFTGFSPNPANADTIAIFLLTGNADPDLATSKVQLIDFRNTNYVSDDVWRDTANVIIPASPGLSYIAFKYKGSSSWLDVRFDNLALSSSISAPVALFTVPSKTNCISQTVPFTDVSSGNPTSWYWQFIGGTPATATVANPVIVYNSPGTYTVSLSSSNSGGSSPATTQTIEILDCTNVIEINNFKKIQLEAFPNPSHEKITLLCSNVSELDFVIYSAIGSQVISGSLTENKEQIIDLTSLPLGIYFLKIKNPNFSKTMKIVKE